MANDAPEQNTQNKRAVRRYYEEVLARRNLAALDELFTSDFVGHSAAYGDYTLAAMRRDIAREQKDMSDDETTIEEQIAEGNRVVTRWRYRWRHDLSLFGETPTGQWLTMEGVQIDRLVGGRIAERWEVKDFWGVVTQLGGAVTFSDKPDGARAPSRPRTARPPSPG